MATIKLSAANTVNSAAIFKQYWNCWKLSGIGFKQYRLLWRIYDVFINITITIGNPLLMCAALFTQNSVPDLVQNLAIAASCTVCTVQHYFYRYQLGNIEYVEDLLSKLDKSVITKDEVQDFKNNSKPGAMRVWNAMFYFGFFSNVFSLIKVFYSKERQLLHPSLFPFNWQRSAYLFWFCVFYQFTAVGIQIIQNFCNDSYGAMMFCLLAGHVRMLRMRIASIGQGMLKSTEQQEQQLIKCALDHKLLTELVERC